MKNMEKIKKMKFKMVENQNFNHFKNSLLGEISFNEISEKLKGAVEIDHCEFSEENGKDLRKRYHYIYNEGRATLIIVNDMIANEDILGGDPDLDRCKRVAKAIQEGWALTEAENYETFAALFLIGPLRKLMENYIHKAELPPILFNGKTPDEGVLVALNKIGFQVNVLDTSESSLDSELEYQKKDAINLFSEISTSSEKREKTFSGLKPVLGQISGYSPEIETGCQIIEKAAKSQKRKLNIYAPHDIKTLEIEPSQEYIDSFSMNNKFFEKIVKQFLIANPNNKAVFSAAQWVREKQQMLFRGWEYPDFGIFIFWGIPENDTQKVLIAELLPLMFYDVLLVDTVGEGEIIFDKVMEYPDSEDIGYPQGITIENTMAFSIDKEATARINEQIGLYSSDSVKSFEFVPVNMIADEVSIMLKLETPYRVGFEFDKGKVKAPRVCAKISGGESREFWEGRLSKIKQSAMVANGKLRKIQPPENPEKYLWEKSDRIKRESIKEDPNSLIFGLPEDAQNFILDKVEKLIRSKMMKNGDQEISANEIVWGILYSTPELKEDLYRSTFILSNPPAFLFLNLLETGEGLTKEDAILMAFGKEIGCDIIYYTSQPQTVNKYFKVEFFHLEYEFKFFPDIKVEERKKLLENISAEDIAEIEEVQELIKKEEKAGFLKSFAKLFSGK